MAKTQEPNQKVNTVDETSGLVSSPVSESVRIGCIIDADTGTTNRVVFYICHIVLFLRVVTVGFLLFGICPYTFSLLKEHVGATDGVLLKA